MPKIIEANFKHLDEVARLFNLYRIFYKQPDDLERAHRFIKGRMEMKESIIFVSDNADGTLSGFVQLYPSFCSVSTISILILYDLFVDPDIRTKGIGRALMNKAKGYAQENGFKRLELSTAKDNFIGQSLYESLGYEVDEEFLHYSIEINKN